MNPNLFDQVTKRFGEHRLSRRTAVGASLAAGAAAVTGTGIAAQDATPAATSQAVAVSDAQPTSTQHFVQSFQSGSIAPSASEFGTHTVILEQGLARRSSSPTVPPARCSLPPPPPSSTGSASMPTTRPTRP